MQQRRGSLPLTHSSREGCGGWGQSYWPDKKSADALREAFRELGYVEGQNVILEPRYAEGKAERFQEFAEEMVHLKVDIIVVFTTPAALAAKNATTTIPIVFPTAIDPVGTGVITSLRHPGGNITGVAIIFAELCAKRLGLLMEVVPGVSRTAVVWNGAIPRTRSPGEKRKMRLARSEWRSNPTR